VQFPTGGRPGRALTRRERFAAQLHARRTWRTGLVVAVSGAGGLAAAYFTRLCDLAMRTHARLYELAPWATLLLLPAGFVAIVWLTRRFAPEAAGSGIPQVVAAADERWRGRWGG
jgi:H+/Cl- antiporter ClcA